MNPQDTSFEVVPVHSRKYPGLDVIFSSLDVSIVSEYKWHVRKSENGTFYARTGGHARKPCIQMHRLILGLSRGDPDVDHINGNGLDNRRSNLRLCNDSQNQANRKKMRISSSKYRGVTWHARAAKWQASVKVRQTNIYLGLFLNEDEAALAYNRAAHEHFGEFASLNDVRINKEAA